MTIEDLPFEKNCKKVYRVKYHANGSMEKYKAKPVIRGDEHVEGFDYNETFSPIAKMASVQCFLAITAQKDGNYIKWA